jgi:hypothetical protein
MKNILILGAVIIVVLGLILVLSEPKQSEAPGITSEVTPIIDAAPTAPDTPPATKLKADTFTGTLTKVDTGCFADGECYIEVDGKKVTAIMGFSQEVAGSVMGVEGFGDLESYIGKPVEVYAQDNSDGTYTLYGSAGFYIKVLE